MNDISGGQADRARIRRTEQNLKDVLEARERILALPAGVHRERLLATNRRSQETIQQTLDLLKGKRAAWLNQLRSGDRKASASALERGRD